MSKSPEQVKEFIEALQYAGYDPKIYSGRGMFGKYCVSVSSGGEDDATVSAWEIAKALWYGVDEKLNIPAPREDSMGRGIVLYWPSYEWPEGK